MKNKVSKITGKSSTVDMLTEIENGIQYFLIPLRGLYRITARGSGYGTDFGGLGASVSGIFKFKEGDRLKIIVGQAGRSDQPLAAGGAGGSFVLNAENELLIAAGGAGGNDHGLEKMSLRKLSDAKLSANGNDASDIGVMYGRHGGLGKGGERGSTGSGGGSGVFSDGADHSGIGGTDTVIPARSLYDKNSQHLIKQNVPEDFAALGGQYMELRKDVFGDNIPYYSEGGFGGGGAGAKMTAGGGGGFSGGSGGGINGTSGGGGCFLRYTGGRQFASIDNNKTGQVIVTMIGIGIEEPYPMTWYLIFAFSAGIGLTAVCGCCLSWISRMMDYLLPTDTILREKLKEQRMQAAYEAAFRKIEYDQLMKQAESARLVRDRDKSRIENEKLRDETSNQDETSYLTKTGYYTSGYDSETDSGTIRKREQTSASSINSFLYGAGKRMNDRSEDLSTIGSMLYARGRRYQRDQVIERKRKSKKISGSKISGNSSSKYRNRSSKNYSGIRSEKKFRNNFSRIDEESTKSSGKSLTIEKNKIVWLRPGEREISEQIDVPGKWKMPSSFKNPTNRTFTKSFEKLIDHSSKNSSETSNYLAENSESHSGSQSPSEITVVNTFATNERWSHLNMKRTFSRAKSVVRPIRKRSGTPDSIRALKARIKNGGHEGFGNRLKLMKVMSQLHDKQKNAEELMKVPMVDRKFKHQVKEIRAGSGVIVKSSDKIKDAVMGNFEVNENEDLKTGPPKTDDEIFMSLSNTLGDAPIAKTPIATFEPLDEADPARFLPRFKIKDTGKSVEKLKNARALEMANTFNFVKERVEEEITSTSHGPESTSLPSTVGIETGGNSARQIVQMYDKKSSFGSVDRKKHDIDRTGNVSRNSVENSALSVETTAEIELDSWGVRSYSR